MGINELTIGEFKELKSLFSQNESEPKNSGILNSAIGEYVIVRSRNEGINAGFLEAADDTGCVLTQARRIWYHKPSQFTIARLVIPNSTSLS